MADNPTHTWNFFSAGGFSQVELASGADLASLGQLDQKLWVALACPAKGLEFDERTLALIDTDHDGRIRVPEIVAAAQWATGLLKNPDDLLRGSAVLPLAAIADGSPEGARILASARQTLANLGKAGATEISLEDTADTTKIFAATLFNGDGIIPEAAAEDPAERAVLADILACQGARTDRSGAPGIGQEQVDAFFTEAEAYAQWWDAAEGDPARLPLGEATVAAQAALQAVRAKVDDYFNRCALAGYDPLALAALNPSEGDYLALAGQDLGGAAAVALPLARVGPGRPLPLRAGLNPAWAAQVAALRSAVVEPLLGPLDSLEEGQWTGLCGRFKAFEDWFKGKPAGTVEPLGLVRIREILAGGARAGLTGLIARDQALEPEADAIEAVEKLIRLHRDLHRLCLNFVNFRKFYDRREPSVFQAGTLYLDQRSCELTLAVDDAARHATMAGMAGAYLAYCDCVRRSTGEKRTIVAVISQGDDDNLMVGRNGIFYDRKGDDWDATIARIVSNPISLRQAFWAPYKKIVKVVEEQIAKRAAAANAHSHGELGKVVEGTAKPAPAKPEEKKIDVGTVAALGVAVGAISTALAYFMGLFKGIAPWQFPLLIAALALAISLPSMVLAFMQLRKRNLGPILDANGWALNARARINVPFGASLTGIAKLPPGSTVSAGDRFAEKRSLWPRLLVLLFLLWWAMSFLKDEGWIYKWTGGRHGNPGPEAHEKR